MRMEGQEVIGTDDTWEYEGCDILMSDLYDGEILDRTYWKNRDNPRKKAVFLDLDKELLTERYSLPVRVKETMDV